MKWLLRVTVLAVIASKAAAQAGTQGVSPRSVSLFDGRTLTGWHPEGEATWTAANGILTAGLTGDGWLRSERTYRDFVLRFQFRNSPRGNSGVFLRASRQTKADGHSNPASAYELQINNEDSVWATGSIEDVIPRLVAVAPKPGQWHEFQVEVRGDRLRASLDGIRVLEGRDSTLAAGYLGLQHHAGMKIEFRRIVIRDLGRPFSESGKASRPPGL